MFMPGWAQDNELLRACSHFDQLAASYGLETDNRPIRAILSARYISTGGLPPSVDGAIETMYDTTMSISSFDAWEADVSYRKQDHINFWSSQVDDREFAGSKNIRCQTSTVPARHLPSWTVDTAVSSPLSSTSRLPLRSMMASRARRYPSRPTISLPTCSSITTRIPLSGSRSCLFRHSP